jgi:hypothetical protein
MPSSDTLDGSGMGVIAVNVSEIESVPDSAAGLLRALLSRPQYSCRMKGPENVPLNVFDES